MPAITMPVSRPRATPSNVNGGLPSLIATMRP
jgi:hypothetical protein